MPIEVVETRVIKGWGCDFTIQVIKDLDWEGDFEASENHVHTVKLKETHSGSVPDEHCAEVVISLSEMNYSWKDRRGKTRASKHFKSHIDLFRDAEDQFVKLLSQHLKKEYDYEKFSQRDWSIIRSDIKVAWSQFIPEKEIEEKISKRRKESVLRGLKQARSSAQLYGFSHIIPEINRLIEEVALFDPIKEVKKK